MTNDPNKKTAHSLNDLIEIARDGKSFYEEAAEKVGDGELKALFTQIAGVKTAIVNELSGVVQAVGGEPETSGTATGSMRQFYGKMRAALGDTEYGYVAELEESEDRLLEAFRETAGDANLPPQAREVAARLLPEVQRVHDVMRDRKHVMKKAS